MSIFVTEIDTAKAPQMRSYLENQGFKITNPPYTFFSAQKEGVSCTLYQSGKLTVQGKKKDELIAFYIEPEILKNFPYSNPDQNTDLEPKIGVDESGKGDFFGPLCIAAVQADEGGIKKLLQLKVRDSKQLTDKNIYPIAQEIKRSFAHSIIRINPKKYNEMYQSFQNLNKLLAWGHAAAIENLIKETGCRHIVSDQFASKDLVQNALEKKGLLPFNLIQRHRAESDPVVAAASILARHAFLESLEKLKEEFGISLPKGASSLVIKAGKEFIRLKGRENLDSVAKLHFKTAQEVLATSLWDLS